MNCTDEMHIIQYLFRVCMYLFHTNVLMMHDIFCVCPYTRMIFEFRETFARKFPKLKQLEVSNLSNEQRWNGVQRSVSKTETTNSFELKSGIVNRKLNQVVVSN
jgi:hypothetical protein